MFTIRQAQMDAFTAARTRSWRQQLLADVRRQQSAFIASLSDRELSQLIEEGLERARSHGLFLRAEAECFVHVFVRYGGDLNNSEDARRESRIARDPRLGIERRFEALGLQAC